MFNNLLIALQIYNNLEQLQNSVKPPKNVKAKRKRNPNPPAP
jgi:hypothetical protein